MEEWKMEDKGRYTVFTRTWWRHNPAWPNGLEPGAGKKTRIAKNVSLAEAMRIAKTYNDTHKPGKLSRKAEFEQQ
jgi:hypothetical protein